MGGGWGRYVGVYVGGGVEALCRVVCVWGGGGLGALCGRGVGVGGYLLTPIRHD